MRPDRTTIAIAVVESEGKYLVGPRAPESTLSGFWEFPGGKVEPGEEIARAAIRECAEETGITVTVLEELLIQDYSYEHADVRLHFFSCVVVGSETTPRPQKPFEWVERARLAHYSFPPANKEVLKRISREP